ncbi:hypothetical protein EU527_05575 [Candidatus Thorarchaeota archaeon]|nr:MAG: hypothetical protein EU527_05575 [Candidatus Thorarchaeota archaeon]
MMDLDILRRGFVAFIDGLWWGLRDNTGALSMYEGYSGGFKQMGLELAESRGGKGPERAASIAGEVLNAIGLDVEVNKKDIFIKSCPIWNRILERGLEFAFHIEEICWKPLLEGIADKTETVPIMESALRLIHIERAKVDYKKTKLKKSNDKGEITKEEYTKQIVILDEVIENMSRYGHYRFE